MQVYANHGALSQCSLHGCDNAYAIDMLHTDQCVEQKKKGSKDSEYNPLRRPFFCIAGSILIAGAFAASFVPSYLLYQCSEFEFSRKFQVSVFRKNKTVFIISIGNGQ